MKDKRRATSFSGSHPALQKDVPISFSEAGKVRPEFDQARDPLIKKQMKDMKKTEASRRKEGGGSRMVKLTKPFPELKPKNHMPQIRTHFNNAWIKEQREAQMRILREQDNLRSSANDRDKTRDFIRSFER